MAGLLDGYVALDLTDLRGQFCGKVLRDLGMTVIKVEPPAGDPVRRLGPFKDDHPGLEASLRFAFLNAGKQSLTLDFASDDGRALLLRLVEQVDVLLESADPGTLERQGLGAATLQAHNPRLVVTSVTSFGQDGPNRDLLAPHLVTFAMGGLMFIGGAPDRPPVSAPETQGFYYPAIHAALGTVMALWGVEQDGVGERVDVAAQEALATQEHLIRIFGSLGQTVQRQGSQHPYAAPANIFPTEDGFVFLFASKPHWPKLLKVWKDHPPQLDEPEWLPDNVRRDHVDYINEQVSLLTQQYTKEAFAQLMQENGIPCLPVNRPGEFADDPQLAARGALGMVEHSTLGAYRQVGFPLLIDGERPAVEPPPLLGQHTVQLLRERAGLSAAEIELLFAQGTI